MCVCMFVCAYSYQYCIEMLYGCSNKSPQRNYKKEYSKYLVLFMCVIYCNKITNSISL